MCVCATALIIAATEFGTRRLACGIQKVYGGEMNIFMKGVQQTSATGERASGWGEAFQPPAGPRIKGHPKYSSGFIYLTIILALIFYI